jgi:hypothetical protein
MTTEQARVEMDKDRFEDYLANLQARREMDRD